MIRLTFNFVRIRDSIHKNFIHSSEVSSVVIATYIVVVDSVCDMGSQSICTIAVTSIGSSIELVGSAVAFGIHNSRRTKTKPTGLQHCEYIIRIRDRDAESTLNLLHLGSVFTRYFLATDGLFCDELIIDSTSHNGVVIVYRIGHEKNESASYRIEHDLNLRSTTGIMLCVLCYTRHRCSHMNLHTTHDIWRSILKMTSACATSILIINPANGYERTHIRVCARERRVPILDYTANYTFLFPALELLNVWTFANSIKSGCHSIKCLCLFFNMLLYRSSQIMHIYANEWEIQGRQSV